MDYSHRIATEQDSDLILEGVIETWKIEQCEIPSDLTETRELISNGVAKEQVIIVICKEG